MTNSKYHLANKSYIYPYSAIPESTRRPLERSFQISNIDVANPSEMLRRLKLDDINGQQELVRTYCRDELTEPAYEATALGMIEDLHSSPSSYPDESDRAGQALADFFYKKSPGDCFSTENIYIAGLLQDRKRLTFFRQRTCSQTKGEPSAAEWLTAPSITSAPMLFEIVSTINIESILISGVTTLRQLVKHPGKDRATLDLLRYSEQVITPIAEVIGFDSLAMSLNNVIKCLRLVNGQRPDLVIKANAVLDRFRNYDRSHDIASNTCKAFREIVSQLVDKTSDDIKPRLPIDYDDNNRSVYGDTGITSIDTGQSTVNATWRFRLKSAGSLAWKMYMTEKANRDTSITTMDILGITAVVRDESEQTKLFRTIVTGLYSDGNGLEPYAAPTKSSPIHIRGTDKYIERMSQGISPNYDIDIRRSDTAESLHLGKVTGFYHQLPFEVQCVSRPYRDAMQTGQISHIIYKNNPGGVMSHQELCQWEKSLQDIRSRRSHLGYLGLVGSSYDINDGQRTVGDNEQLAISYIREILTDHQAPRY